MQENGQEAITHYRVITRFRSHTHVKVKLETGRTHQIRAHLAYINHPLVGDQLYGGRMSLPSACSITLAECLRSFQRQALHACCLKFCHPASGKLLVWEHPRPKDMEQLLEHLASDHKLEPA